MDDQQRINNILAGLETQYAGAKSPLNYSTPFELVVATILAAQCTDERVNKVTPELFRRFGTAEKMSQAPLVEVESLIQSCGLYHNKAKNLVQASKQIIEEFGGQVPDTMEGLMKLAGVGRKTANVVLSNIFNKQAIAVDTHVFRVARRLGLADQATTNPLQTEKSLMQNIPREKWSAAHRWLIYHGRQVCSARKPACLHCNLQEFCLSANNNSSPST